MVFLSKLRIYSLDPLRKSQMMLGVVTVCDCCCASQYEQPCQFREVRISELLVWLNGMVIRDNGRVGIGTTTPDNTLHLIGDQPGSAGGVMEADHPHIMGC